MKSVTLVCAIAAASLGFSSLTFAQNDRRGSREELPRHAQQQERDQNRYQQRDHRSDRREDRRDWRQDRREERRDWREDRRNDRYESRRLDRRTDRHGHVYYYNARGPEFRRGGHVPRAYRHQQYRVVNYRAHHLHTPPRGHVWVQVGGDYVLMAIATGIIASIILSH